MVRAVSAIALLLMLLASCSRDYLNVSPPESNFLLQFRCPERQLEQRHGIRAEQFGLFSRTLWQDYFSSLHSEVVDFGVFPRYVHWYIQINDRYPEDIVDYNDAMGIKTIINQDLQALGYSHKRNRSILTEIVEGKWDRHFRAFARAARRKNNTIYYRFGYEMNGNWFPWCEQPDKFVEAWRHVWTIFRKEHAYNVQWVFSPSVLWDESPFLHRIHPYYPGDVFVDVVALDGYNFGDGHSRHHRWQSFGEVFGESLAQIHTYGKPVWIAEIGCPSDPRRPDWLKEFFDFMDNSCSVTVFLWFNDYKPGEPDFRIQSDSASLHLFRQWVGAGSGSVRGLL